MSHYDKQREEWDEQARKEREEHREPAPMARDQIIAELLRLADVHSEMSVTLWSTVGLIQGQQAVIDGYHGVRNAIVRDGRVVSFVRDMDV